MKNESYVNVESPTVTVDSIIRVLLYSAGYEMDLAVRNHLEMSFNES